MKKLITLLPFIFILACCETSEPAKQPIDYTGSYQYVAESAPMAPKKDVGLTLEQSGYIVKAAVNDGGTTHFLELKQYAVDRYTGAIETDGRKIELRVYESAGEVWGFYLVSFEDQSRNYGFISKLEKK